HLVHDRQGSGPRADNQAPALPGYIFLDRERRVPKGRSELFGWLLIPLADVATIDDDVTLIGRSIDTDLPKGKLIETQNTFGLFPLSLTAPPAHKFSRNLNSINIGLDPLDANAPLGSDRDANPSIFGQAVAPLFFSTRRHFPVVLLHG